MDLDAATAAAADAAARCVHSFRDLCRSTLRRYVVYLLQTQVLPDDEPFTEDYCETRVRLFVNKPGIIIRAPRCE